MLSKEGRGRREKNRLKNNRGKYRNRRGSNKGKQIKREGEGKDS